MRNHRMTLMAGCVLTTSLLAGAALASTQNPDVRDASPMGFNSGGDTMMEPTSSGIDYGLAAMTVASDDRAPRISDTDGHIAYAADTDDDQLFYDATPPAYVVAAGLTATTAAGAIAPS